MRRKTSYKEISNENEISAIFEEIESKIEDIKNRMKDNGISSHKFITNENKMKIL